jgi:outer membrane lipoprotein-sorting protein
MSRTITRWAVPVGVAAAVFAVGAGVTALRVSADPTLPARDAAQLLVDLQNAKLEGLSGTVVQRAELGLPALPGQVGSGSAQLSSLLGGTHTLRVWYAGPEKVRVALLGKVGESDVIRNGRDVWMWSSEEQEAQHRTLPDGFAVFEPGRALHITPQELADRVLEAIDPSTVVSTAGTDRVAGRPVYELVLAPRDGASLISNVRLGIDSEKKVPLRIQVNAKGMAKPAFEVAFQQVDFTRPGDEHFTFTPPPGTRVNEGDRPEKRGMDRKDHQGRLVPGKPAAPGKPAPDAPAAAPKPATPDKPTAEKPRTTVIGTGWTPVLVARMDGQQDLQDNPLGAFVTALPRVSGDWGSGHVLRTNLVTALLTDDGRLLVGAVNQQRLFAVAADPAAALK